jgi:excisionase family DNA binding protein
LPAREQYWTTQPVADRLHVSPKTVTRWANEGRIKGLRTPGRHLRIPESEVVRLEQEMQAAVPPGHQDAQV